MDKVLTERSVDAVHGRPHHLDVTHPDANEAGVVRLRSERYAIAADAIATIGDLPNDVLVFARSGLSIAMGNADREVQRAARRATTTNDEDGFANAVERFILKAN
jgi:hydroxymethylpyrimidine pyrophosphatase-like HAD family hydrolase